MTTNVSTDSTINNAQRRSGAFAPSSALRILLCAILASVMLAGVIRHSFKVGRLSVYPRVDDIMYMDDGLSRLQTLKEEGLGAAIHQFIHTPPHSPYSGLLASASFAIFGVHDWAPYVGNWPLLFAIFLFADAILTGASFWQRGLCLIFVASVPLVAMAAHEFRPDFAASLLTAAGIFWLLMPAAADRPMRRYAAIGLLFGLAMVVKPPFFPATLVFFASAWAMRLWADRPWLSTDDASAWKRGLLISLFAMVLICAPFYLIGGKDAIEYIYENQFGARRMNWVLHGGRLSHLKYYLSGDGGWKMLAYHLYLLGAMLIVCCAAILSKARDRRSLVRTAIPWTVMLGLTWLLPTLNPHKLVEFALTFQILLVFVVLRLVVYLLAGLHARQWSAALIAMTLLGVACFHWPENVLNRAFRADRTRLINGVYHTVIDGVVPGSTLSETRPRKNVVLTGAGDLNIWLLDYMARRDSKPVDFTSPHDTNKVDDFSRAFDDADYVIASDPGSVMYSRILLTSQIQDALLQIVRSRPDFRQIARFNLPGVDQYIYVFQRVHHVQNRSATPPA